MKVYCIGFHLWCLPTMCNIKFRAFWCFTLVILLSSFNASSQNHIQLENLKPGSPSSEWDITGAGDLSIQGFATDISVNIGEPIDFKIKTDATAYTIDIYRLGYYQGNGARKVGTGTVTATLPQNQPPDLYDPVTGLTKCSNWNVSANWAVPADAVSGIYIAKLTRSDNNGASHIIFIVRDDASTSDLLFQTADATWQAYNGYGGNSLYVDGNGIPGFNHATKVSYDRPFVTRAGGGGGGAYEDWVFSAEYPMLRWLEMNGYDVTYTTNVDTDRRGNLIQNHKVFLSVGHDEYWSKAQRENVEAARNAGVHLAFFSGNEVYWKTRWEDNYRTLVCYKEGNGGENNCGNKCDPSSEWTGLWREGCEYPTSDGCKPENALSGQLSWADGIHGINVPAEYKYLRFWRNTSVAALPDGGNYELPVGTLGYEWDWENSLYASHNPPGRILMSSTTIAGKTHKLSLYLHTSGALVFGAGTVQWSWGLDENHDPASTASTIPAPSIVMQQATVNLLADMDVQPGNLQAGLVAATKSTDITPPVTIILTAINGATIPAGAPFIISGTSSDAGGVVAGIEVSTDGGTTWQVANGTSTWSYSWSPSATGPATIKVRGFDDSGNMETTTTEENEIEITVTNPDPVTCPCTIFNVTDVPAIPLTVDNQQITVGVKFQSTENGYITGIRYYKGTGTTGTHSGQLWTSTGTLLAQATFVNESASGWQQVNFATSVAITSGTIYVASYHSSSGDYAATDNYFTQPVIKGSLKALANGEDGGNGVYSYGSLGTFPVSTYGSSNYWVDVVFNTNVEPDETAPNILTTSPSNSAGNVDPNSPVTITFNEAIDESTLSSQTVELKEGNNIVSASITYSAGNYQVKLTPSATLNYNTTYSVTLKGGAADPRIKDLAGNVLAANYIFSFTTASPPPPPPTEGPGGPILVISAASNPFSRYPVEILRAQGLNEFMAVDISTVDAATLNSYDVIILGDMPLNTAQVTMFTDWTNAGGTFITFKPDHQLAGLLGITPTGGTLSDKYIKVNTATSPGYGIVNETIQYHGMANLYILNGATAIASLYSDASTATSNPAVTTIDVGANGGKAIAFTYDLARSIVYTRQGNPALEGQSLDGQQGPIRSNNLFYNGWLDMNKVAIPQADEQQHLLTNIILKSNMHKKPLLRFWFLPRGLKAAVVMTGDDHASGGTVPRFNKYLTLGPNTAEDVADWKAIRGTSYIFHNTPISNQVAVDLQSQGFEIALHVNTECANYTPTTLENTFSSQLASFASNYPGLHSPVTNRTHCIAWSDYTSQASIEASKGIRLDANYYYWPAAWVQDRPGMFTGSGMPMRFADKNGNIIDNYQAATQMTDESGITYSTFISALLDKALGPEGFYGVFNANMHTDFLETSEQGSDAIIAAAKSRNVPVISAKQILDWLDGRNNSSFSNMSWNEKTLNFSVTTASGSRNIQAMLPQTVGDDQLASLTINGSSVSFTIETIKGIAYAFFFAADGDYVATYGPATQTLAGTVSLQGRPSAPNAAWQVPLEVKVYSEDGQTLISSHTPTTNEQGQFTITGIPAGNYKISVKHSHTLMRVKQSTLNTGITNIDFGIMLEGDADNDNKVSLADFSILLSTYNKNSSMTGYDARANFNEDISVSLADFSLLLSNYNKTGEKVNE